MYKKPFYRLLIATALAMTSNTTYTMMTACCRAKKQKPDQYVFKTASDIPMSVGMSYAALGIIVGGAQQYFCATQWMPAESRESLLGFSGCGSLLAGYCGQDHHKGVINRLHNKNDGAITELFEHINLDGGLDRSRSLALFITRYKQMRDGKIPLDPALVAAHNDFLVVNVKVRAFFGGYMIGAALGMPASLALVHMYG